EGGQREVASPQRRGIEVGIIKGGNGANQDPKSHPQQYRSQSYPTLIHVRFYFCCELSLQQNGEHVLARIFHHAQA
ncbi:MAG: hypothetical protein KAI21_05635, partial [Deltaproteobacteria bacterium]|nr:hypothetical protein [Deltaproteobacteria bacterium]